MSAGDIYRHKNGNEYQEAERRIAQATIFEGEMPYLNSLSEQTATATDKISELEEMVFYFSINPAFVRKWWVRPARLFDDGRFVKVGISQ